MGKSAGKQDRWMGYMQPDPRDVPSGPDGSDQSTVTDKPEPGHNVRVGRKASVGDAGRGKTPASKYAAGGSVRGYGAARGAKACKGA